MAATSSKITLSLIGMAGDIDNARKCMENAKKVFSIQTASLNALVAKYKEAVDTIQAYPDGALWEDLQKDDLARKTAEFIALRADAQLAIADLAKRTEF